MDGWMDKWMDESERRVRINQEEAKKKNPELSLEKSRIAASQNVGRPIQINPPGPLHFHRLIRINSINCNESQAIFI